MWLRYTFLSEKHLLNLSNVKFIATRANGLIIDFGGVDHQMKMKDGLAEKAFSIIEKALRNGEAFIDLDEKMTQ